MDWSIILSNVSIVSLASLIVSGVITYILQTFKYKYDYYKMILAKRIEVYSILQNKLSILRKGIVNKDNLHQRYIIMFHNNLDDFQRIQQDVSSCIELGLWMGNETVKDLQELNLLFLVISQEIRQDETNIKSIGHKYTKSILEIRDRIENDIKKDLLNLHKVKKFLNGKIISENVVIKL